MDTVHGEGRAGLMVVLLVVVLLVLMMLVSRCHERGRVSNGTVVLLMMMLKGMRL